MEKRFGQFENRKSFRVRVDTTEDFNETNAISNLRTALQDHFKLSLPIEVLFMDRGMDIGNLIIHIPEDGFRIVDDHVLKIKLQEVIKDRDGYIVERIDGKEKINIQSVYRPASPA